MNQIVQYREQALTPELIEKLDVAAGNCLKIQNRVEFELYTEKDEYGDAVEKRRYVTTGKEIIQTGHIPEALMESLLRPAPARHIAVHLTRLAAHKPYARGENGFNIIISDLCGDLEGVSEYAVIKACAMFRRDETIRFFPDTAILQKQILEFDRALKGIEKKPREQEKKTEPQPQRARPDFKQVRRVKTLVRLAFKARTSWEQKFMDAYPRHVKGT